MSQNGTIPSTSVLVTWKQQPLKLIPVYSRWVVIHLAGVYRRAGPAFNRHPAPATPGPQVGSSIVPRAAPRLHAGRGDGWASQSYTVARALLAAARLHSPYQPEGGCPATQSLSPQSLPPGPRQGFTRLARAAAIYSPPRGRIGCRKRIGFTDPPEKRNGHASHWGRKG